jgi:hypothetical protein
LGYSLFSSFLTRRLQGLFKRILGILQQTRSSLILGIPW